MTADPGSGAARPHAQLDAEARVVAGHPDAGGGPSVDARGALGVQVGEGNFQVNYTYRLTVTDGIAPPPLVSVAGVVDSPYRGLRSFGERDAAFFFGREAAATEVLERMSRQLPGTGLLVVSGVSGAGKSSLVQAGVLPMLRGTGLASARAAASWPCLVLTPAHAPLDELAVRVASLTGTDAAQVRRGLEDDPAGFALTARQATLTQAALTQAAPTQAAPTQAALAQAAPTQAGGQPGDQDTPGPQPRLLLVVDQFEQLFTQCPDEEQRRAFITALHAAAAASPGHAPAALVVLVVRADFEARLADYPQLAAAVQDRYLVTAMTGRQLRLAITEPARRAGAGVDGDLVEVLLREVSTRQPATSAATAGAGTVSAAGVLPLLSHALDQAWRNRAGDVLALADYERTGGIEGAVADSAERAFGSLTPAQRAAARQVFTRLTVTGSDGADTAARVTRAEFTAGKTADGVRDVEAVLEAFAAERLLTLAAGTVEISHEILLAAWGLLRDTWLAETRTDRVVRSRLGSVAADWERGSRDRSYLYSGTLLQAAAETAARIRADPARYPPLTAAEQDFLRASDRAQRRGTRRRRGLVAFFAALAVGFAAVAGVAVNAQRAADHARTDALAGQLIAQSGSSLAAANPALAKLESIAAWRLNPSSGQARDAMLNAATLTGIATLDDKGGAVSSVAFSPDGRTLAIGDQDGTARLWDLATGQPVGGPLKSGDGPVFAVAFSPDGKTLAAGQGNDRDGAVSLWNVGTRRPVGTALTTPGGRILSVAFSPDGKTLAAGGQSGARLWDVATRRPVGSLLTTGGISGTVWSVAFSRDGKTLAAGDEDGTVRLWDVAARRPVGSLSAAGSGSGAVAVSAVAFSPDGTTLVAGGQGDDGDGAVWLWNVATRRPVGSLLSPGSVSGAVFAVAFSPDGKTVAVGDEDGTARLWDVAARRPVGSPLASGGGTVFAVAFSPDGKTLATGDEDGTTQLWDAGVAMNAVTGTPVPGVPDSASAVAFSPDGKTLAVGGRSGDGDDGAVWLWDAGTRRPAGNPLVSAGGQVTAVAFSPDGKTLATVTGTVSVSVTGSTASGSGPPQLWDLATHRHNGVAADSTMTGSVAFSPDGKILAVGGFAGNGNERGAVWLWNVPAGHQIGGALTPAILAGGVTSVAFSPDRKTLAVGGFDGNDDGTVWLWNVATGHQAGHFPTGGGVTSVAFGPDGTTLAAGVDDGTARLWDVATGRPVGNPLASTGGPVTAVAFSPDGKTLAVGGIDTGDHDGTVQLWDVDTGGQIGGARTIVEPLLAAEANAVSAVTFSRNSATLAAGDSDGLVRLWDVAYLANPVPYLCASAGRFITPAQWADDVPGIPYQSVCPG